MLKPIKNKQNTAAQALSNGFREKELFVYVHIPYCLRRCSYCDFAVYEKGKGGNSKDYINTVRQEIQNKQSFFKGFQVKTVYFGGGTPSLIPGGEIVSILQELKTHFVFSENPEITIEVNPGTLSEEKISLYRSSHINRYSLGVQSFEEGFLKKSGRSHTVSDSIKDLLFFQKEKLNFSLDLMFGLPDQSLKDLKKDVQRALSFDPPHVSLYNLTVPSRHNLARNRASDEEQGEMFEWIEEALLKRGLIKYEISNCARKGRESRHNRAYWEGKDVLGFGLSAHSYFKTLPGEHDLRADYGLRFWNSPHLKTYMQQVREGSCTQSPIDNLPDSQKEFLKIHEALTDFCHTRLRKKEGFSLKELFLLFPQGILKPLLSRLLELKNQKYLENTEDCFYLTKKGEILSNLVFLQLTFLEKEITF